MEIILASVVAFATTNLDDIFILTLFFSNPKFHLAKVVAGQYLGISTLIAISFMASFIGLIVDPKYIGVLGLIPIYMGIKSAIDLVKENRIGNKHPSVELDMENHPNRHQVFLVASVTIANGGDNISIYVPLFATISLADKFVMALIFLLMTALWCVTARYLSKRPMVQTTLQKYGHLITPFIFILLGTYILFESGFFEMFK